MNLVDKLLKTDAKKADEMQTKILRSKRLAKIIGETEPVEITVKELPSKRMNDLIGMQLNSKGNFDASKSYDAQAILTSEAVTNPNLKDEELMKHFNCKTPKDLAIKLFGNELKKISDAVVELSGFADNDRLDEEIKN